MKDNLQTRLRLILAVFVFLSCSYWVFRNVNFNKLFNLSGTDSSELGRDGTQSSCIGFTPRRELEAVGNDVVELLADGSREIIFSGGESDLVGVLRDPYISHSGNYLCFLSETGQVTMLYLYNIVNDDLIEIGEGQNCFWSSGDSFISYYNSLEDSDLTVVDVYVYDTAEGLVKNLTLENLGPGIIKRCLNMYWKDDTDLYVECEYFDNNNVYSKAAVYDARNGNLSPRYKQ